MSKEPREFFEDKVGAQLLAFQDELEELDYRVENRGWESDIEIQQELMELGVKLKALRKDFQVLKTIPDQSWQLQKEDLENALQELSASIKDMISRLGPD
ncbi:MAG: hypothetical protein OEW05_06435 [Candidatus Aminicenantes bacterium]|nr:hypothetical protein [Candidatus Aminicenantes bacterium]